MNASVCEILIQNAREALEEAEHELRRLEKAELDLRCVFWVMIHMRRRLSTKARSRRICQSHLGRSIRPRVNHLEVDAHRRMERMHRLSLPHKFSPEIFSIITEAQWID